MNTPVLMPKLGESVVEGTVSRWLKGVGDSVTRLEPLLEVSTDKIDTELPAPASGVLLEIVAEEGSTVVVGAILARIGDAQSPEGHASGVTSQPDARSDAEAQRRGETQSPEGHASGVTSQPDAQSDAESAVGHASGVTSQPDARSDAESAVGHASGVTSQPDARSDAEAQRRGESQNEPAGRSYLSPVVQRMAADHSVDLEKVQGSGQGGRITKQDLLAYLEAREQTAGTRGVAPAPALAADEILHPLTTMRRSIAQHMVQSVATSQHVTTIFEVDMTAVAHHREAEKADFEQRGIRLTFTPYFVAAAAAALAHHPLANSRFSAEGIVEHKRIHIGVAVATDGGLIVPVVRDANEMNLAGLSRSVQDLAERARGGKLAPDDVSGGTFTITNHGVGGSLFATPILNQPQSAILGVGAIVKRPVVMSMGGGRGTLLPDATDAIAIRPMCYLSLSFDHRVLDGAGADAFVASIKARLEAWSE